MMVRVNILSLLCHKLKNPPDLSQSQETSKASQKETIENLSQQQTILLYAILDDALQMDNVLYQTAIMPNKQLLPSNRHRDELMILITSDEDSSCGRLGRSFIHHYSTKMASALQTALEKDDCSKLQIEHIAQLLNRLGHGEIHASISSIKNTIF